DYYCQSTDSTDNHVLF
nr:immunoglobulin light chain junction region [Macaca mulatta]MOY06376.1 immunoglobulin light chain junction region [Macaca mulatta]MOY07007.1 immunoglobulin light chain junction region [Macaca mulatta]